MTTTVALCDDDKLVLESLARVLQANKDIQVIATYSRGQDAVSAEISADVWLVDVQMPGMSGHEVVRRLCSRKPTPNVVMMTSYPDESMLDALAAGAIGFIFKDDYPAHMAAVIHAAAAGLSVNSRTAVQALLPQQRALDTAICVTKAQSRFLEIVLQGLSNREMAAELGITESAVKKRIGQLLKRADVNSRPKLVRKAQEVGWIIDRN